MTGTATLKVEARECVTGEGTVEDLVRDIDPFDFLAVDDIDANPVSQAVADLGRAIAGTDAAVWTVDYAASQRTGEIIARLDYGDARHGTYWVRVTVDGRPLKAGWSIAGWPAKALYAELPAAVALDNGDRCLIYFTLSDLGVGMTRVAKEGRESLKRVVALSDPLKEHQMIRKILTAVVVLTVTSTSLALSTTIAAPEPRVRAHTHRDNHHRPIPVPLGDPTRPGQKEASD